MHACMARLFVKVIYNHAYIVILIKCLILIHLVMQLLKFTPGFQTSFLDLRRFEEHLSWLRPTRLIFWRDFSCFLRKFVYSATVFTFPRGSFEVVSRVISSANVESNVPNLMQMSKILCSSSFALDSAHEKFDVWTIVRIAVFKAPYTRKHSMRFCIVYCSQGNREQYENAGKRFRVYGALADVSYRSGASCIKLLTAI